MTLRLHQLRLVSFNCRGWYNGRSTVADLLDSHDICLIQEHWLFNDQLNQLNFNLNFLSVGVSGMDSSILLHGRPFGGCAMLFRKSLISSVTMLSTNAKRFCAVRLSDQSGYSVLLICVYLPTDYGTLSSRDDFLYVIGELEGFINSQSFNSLLIVGDFNADFNRSSPNTTQLISFMEEFNLVSVDLCYRANVQFTYEGSNSSSWLDHILTSRHFASCFTSVQKLDIATNLCDHHPLSCVFDYSVCNTPHSVPLPAHQFVPRTAWNKVTDIDIQNFCRTISDSLPALPSDLSSSMSGDCAC